MRSLLILTLLLNLALITLGQKVGIGTNTPKAALDVTSTNNGFLPPRMTRIQRDAIQNPEPGLMIYCTDCLNSGEWQGFNGQKWVKMSGEPTSDYLPSINVGYQNWSSKNLDVAHYQNGDPIPQVTDPTQWRSLTTGAWCWYNNDSATYGAKYGRLYNWYAINDPRGIAPPGWRVPTMTDWNKLISFLDNTADTSITSCQDCLISTSVGRELKSDSGWYNNLNGSNSIGFNGLPGGISYGDFFSILLSTQWWISNESSPSSGIYIYTGVYDDNIYYLKDPKTTGCYVRLVRENINLKPVLPMLRSPKITINRLYPADTLNVEGVVVSDGSSPITERGILWSFHPQFSISPANKIVLGNGIGSFSYSINNPIIDSTIFIRTYAINNQGTSYSREVSFNSNNLNAVSNGYFYHPAAPRAIEDLPKTLTRISPTSWETELGDLGSSGYYIIITIDTLTNGVTVTSSPNNTQISSIVMFTNSLPSTNPGYSPQWLQSAACTNTYDPIGRKFKLRYGYLGGSGYRVVEEIIQLIN